MTTTRQHLLSIDPGGMGGDTGIVLIGYGDDTPAYLVESWVVKGEVQGFLEWWDAYDPWLPDVVVCEHFVNYNVRGADLTPCFIEGAVIAACFIDRDDKPVLQSASGKDSAVPDEVLKRMDMWLPGDHHHDRREAARHGLWYLKRLRHKLTLERMFPQP